MEYEKLKESVEHLRMKGITEPETGIVLGTGLGKMADAIEVEAEVPYAEIPHFPEATVEFHAGKLIYGDLDGRKVLAMKGRFHYYEGYGMDQLVFPVRVMKLLGIQELLISNAGGAMNLDMKKGQLMLIEDQINLLPSNPLIGANIEELGPRFVDMSEPYDREMNERLRKLAKQEGIVLNQGVYVAAQGPMLETAAEYRYMRNIGADVVGMSTVPEVIAARHMGLPCAAITVITDECDPDDLRPIDIDEVIELAGRAEEELIRLYRGLIREWVEGSGKGGGSQAF